MKEIFSFSALTCLQQSIMNLGILAVQGLVNSFGTTIMALLPPPSKIDAFAYLPVQDFGNASRSSSPRTTAQARPAAIRKGIRTAMLTTVTFGLALSALVWVLAAPLMGCLSTNPATAGPVIAEGVRYLHIEGAFYALIGVLFLLYGLYRALGRPGMSVVLTVVSLGLRVTLAYALSALPGVGVVGGIWWSVPIGWVLADAFGILYYLRRRRTLVG